MLDPAGDGSVDGEFVDLLLLGCDSIYIASIDYLHAMLDLERCIRNQHQDIHAFKCRGQGRWLVVVGLSHGGAGLAEMLEFLGFARD